MISSLALIPLLILGSFIVSSTEISLFSLSRLQLIQIKETSKILFRRIRQLHQDSAGLLITALLLNEIFNISIVSILTSHYVDGAPIPELWSRFGGEDWLYRMLYGVALTTPVIMIFCELTPKTIGTRMPVFVASQFTPIIHLFYRILSPLVRVIRWILPRPAETTKADPQIREDDILTLAEEQRESGNLHEHEVELIKNVFELDDLTVDGIATPLRNLPHLTPSTPLTQALEFFKAHPGELRLPVFSTPRDTVVGVLHLKDVIELKIDRTRSTAWVRDYLQDPLFFSPKTTLETAFRKMRALKVQTAFVQNNKGLPLGMISIQTIIDFLIEEAFEK